VFHPPLFLDEWPSDDHRTRLVFILHDMPKEAIADTFAVLRGESGLQEATDKREQGG
jgi:hypothetical protein